MYTIYIICRATARAGPCCRALILKFAINRLCRCSKTLSPARHCAVIARATQTRSSLPLRASAILGGRRVDWVDISTGPLQLTQPLPKLCCTRSGPRKPYPHHLMLFIYNQQDSTGKPGSREGPAHAARHSGTAGRAQQPRPWWEEIPRQPGVTARGRPHLRAAPRPGDDACHKAS